jgi:hypothetical protein
MLNAREGLRFCMTSNPDDLVIRPPHAAAKTRSFRRYLLVYVSARFATSVEFCKTGMNIGIFCNHVYEEQVVQRSRVRRA